MADGVHHGREVVLDGLPQQMTGRQLPSAMPSSVARALIVHTWVVRAIMMMIP
jgi:hypothetical protein